jgi:hypothetical protein
VNEEEKRTPGWWLQGRVEYAAFYLWRRLKPTLLEGEDNTKLNVH